MLSARSSRSSLSSSRSSSSGSLLPVVPLPPFSSPVRTRRRTPFWFPGRRRFLSPSRSASIGRLSPPAATSLPDAARRAPVEKDGTYGIPRAVVATRPSRARYSTFFASTGLLARSLSLSHPLRRSGKRLTSCDPPVPPRRR